MEVRMVIIELLLQVTGVVLRAEQVTLLIMDKEEAEQLMQEEMVDLGDVAAAARLVAAFAEKNLATEKDGM